MEWKSMITDKPEVGKIYAIINAQGKYSVKKYVRGYVHKHNMLTEDLSYKPSYCTGEISEGFISFEGWLGRVIKDPMFFMELPPRPEFSSEEKTAWQIRQLEERIARLEAKAKSKG